VNPRPLSVLCALAIAGAASSQESKQESAVQRVIRGTARVQCPDGSSGTAWVLDRERGILVTNHHVIVATSVNSDARVGLERREVLHDGVAITFPAYREDGSLIAEATYYEKNEAKLAQEGLRVRGLVIDADVARDLAIIKVDKLPKGVLAIPLAAKSQDAGDEHFSIGNPGVSKFRWVFSTGRVKSRGRQDWLTGETLDSRSCQVLNTDALVNPGDSGGPVVNKDGELVAVTEGFSSKARGLSYSIDLAEVKAYAAELENLFDPKSADDHIRRGHFYMMRGRPHMALADFAAAFEDRKKRKLPLDDVQLDFGAARRAQGDLLKAIRTLPSFANDPTLDADIAAEYTASLQICDAVLKTEKRTPGRAYAERAATRLNRMPAEAFIPVALKGAHWKPLIERGKDNPDYKKALAEEQARHDEKWDPLKRELLDDVEAALKEDPKSVLAYRTQARYEGRLVKPDLKRMIEDRTAVVKLRNTAVSRDAIAYLERAAAYAHAKDYSKAAADCESALRIQPRSAVGHVRLARYLLAAKDLKKASSIAVKLVNDYETDDGTQPAIEGLNPNHWELLAGISYEAKDYAAQIQYLTEAMECKKLLQLPPERRLYADRGDAFAARKIAAAAEADYRSAMAIPDFSADKKPISAFEELYRSVYSLPALDAKIKALKK